jgi:hypothetical protein
MMIDPLKRCQVYKNLHTGTWSVRQGGKVVAHPTILMLRDCRFHVQPAGRAKVLAEKKKNVHAYISGFLSSAKECNDNHADLDNRVISYNPYKMESFQDIYGNPVHECDFCDMDSADAFGIYVIAIWKG